MTTHLTCDILIFVTNTLIKKKLFIRQKAQATKRKSQSLYILKLRGKTQDKMIQCIIPVNHLLHSSRENSVQGVWDREGNCRATGIRVAEREKRQRNVQCPGSALPKADSVITLNAVVPGAPRNSISLCWKLVSHQHDLCSSPVAISFCAFDTIMANGAQCPPRLAGFGFKLLQGHSCLNYRILWAIRLLHRVRDWSCSGPNWKERGERNISQAEKQLRISQHKVPMVLSAAGTFAAPCHYWGITGPSVQLLSLPRPTNANQNPTQAAKIFRGFYKTNFNNPFKCFFRIEHEFAKSRVAYSS